MQTKQYYYQLMAQHLIGEFSKRGMEGFYCPTKSDALKTALSLIPEGSSVSYGGSLTLQETGIRDALQKGPYRYLDPNAVQGAGEKQKIAQEAMNADVYLMSSNAIAITGELVNADGIGNRVAALIFGPKQVIVVAGMNKVEPTLEAAITRVKTTASQMCLTLYKQDYPSFVDLQNASEHIISHLVITSMTTLKGRIKVILVGEDLGN